MIKTDLSLKTLLILLLFTISGNAIAFGFYGSDETAYMDAATFPARTGNITSLASGEASIRASGQPDATWRDSVKIESVSFDAGMSARGFTLQVKINNSAWTTPSGATGRCVWYYDCYLYSSALYSVDAYTLPVSVRLLRNNTAVYTPIPSNALIATVVLRQYDQNGRASGKATLYFRFNGAVTPVVPTCDIINFDKNVTLPDVKRTDLVNHGTGRYTGATKEFNINLACEYQPKVNVTFDGDKMPGVASEDVLVNKLTGNDNVGVQILYGSNPLKIGEKVTVLSAAGTNESLKFNAYYYYKGGTVQSGPIKSQTMFTFAYE